MATLRQQIIDLIKTREMDAREISAAVGIREKQVYDHLAHIAKSVRARGEVFRLTPSVCNDCGYSFRDRRRLTRPSRCPRCRCQRITAPTYVIDG